MTQLDSTTLRLLVDAIAKLTALLEAEEQLGDVRLSRTMKSPELAVSQSLQGAQPDLLTPTEGNTRITPAILSDIKRWLNLS